MTTDNINIININDSEPVFMIAQLYCGYCIFLTVSYVLILLVRVIIIKFKCTFSWSWSTPQMQFLVRRVTRKHSNSGRALVLVSGLMITSTSTHDESLKA